MKLATLRFDGEERVGIVNDKMIRFLPPELGDMVELAASFGTDFEAIDDAAVAHSEACSLSDVDFLAPVRRFRRDVLCTGWNYWDHFEEGIGKRDGQEVERPDAPTFFTKAPDAIIGPFDPIAFDPGLSQKWDYEGEIALVIGKTGRNIPVPEARSHIFGYCLANDVSQRDLQRRHGGQWLKGKSIDRSSPLGPFIVTTDGVDLPNVRIETFVNGDRRQDATVRQMAFTVEQLIGELSSGMTLHAGDVVLTGTPSGIGMAGNPPAFLKDGDEVVVRATGLGQIRNAVTRV